MDFKTLKKNSSKSIKTLVDELDKMKSGSAKFSDDRFWSVPVDEKSGNGTALIRFLPATKNAKIPWVTVYSHAFQGPGGWYIENSLTTLGQSDPVREANSALWSTGVEANKELVRKRKRKQKFIANILVLSDPKHPENEGKVFLFKFGKKIFQKIQDKTSPEIEVPGMEAFDPFDFWTGANFRIIVKKVEGYPNYDNSFFEGQTALYSGDDAKLEAIWNSQYDLSEFTDAKNFKSYDELKARFDKVVGNVGSSPAPKAKPTPVAPVTEDEDVPWTEAPAKVKSKPSAPKPVVDEDEDQDLAEFLENFADED